MNERIKELAEQAKKYALDDMMKIADKEEALKVYSNSYDIKFTELIIKECANTIENWKKEPFPFDEDLAVKLIYEHFGLELPPKNIRVIKI